MLKSAKYFLHFHFIFHFKMYLTETLNYNYPVLIIVSQPNYWQYLYKKYNIQMFFIFYTSPIG